MADIELKKSDIPFWFGGNGTVKVHAEVIDPTKPIPGSDNDLLSVDFNVSASQPFSIGANDSFAFGISASADTSIVPLWPTSSAARLKLLDDYGLKDFFAGATHANDLLIIFTAGAKVDANLSAKFKYINLTASAKLEAGADGSYALVRSFPANTPAVDLLKGFFKGLRLPANIEAPLADNEIIVFEYGGYIRFKGTLGFGYNMAGSHSFEINQLQFSEKYGFTLMASLGLSASIAGQFRIEVKQGAQAGWVRVTVHKSRSKFVAIAADVSATTTFQQQGLPESADEFLSSIIGLSSKSWLNLFQQVRELSDFGKLNAYLDKLAKSFIEQYTGKAFAELADKTKLDEVIDLIGKAIDQYNQVGDHAIALFDKYFDVAKNGVDSRLDDALKVIKGATSWDQLKGHIDPTVWDVVQQLTDGDPLTWLLGKIDLNGVSVDSLDELKKRADKVLGLIQSKAHDEILKLITLAKSKFPLDGFLKDLGHIDWLELKTLTDNRLVGFVERLIDKEIAKLGDTDLKKAVEGLHAVLGKVEEFKTKLYDKIKQALDQSFSFTLHSEYSRATENDAVIDFELDLATANGKQLMNMAGNGDFSDVLAAYDRGDVKLHSGILTHKVTRQSKFSVNVVGFGLHSSQEGFDRLITQAEQQIVPDNGLLTIHTTLDMTKEKERKQKRNGERVFTNLLLRFIGESSDALDFDKRNQVYLIDTITKMSANYKLVINDLSTTQQELAQYLSFADDFGLAASDDAAINELAPLLPVDAQGNFGNVSLTYKVRFAEDGLTALFKRKFDDLDEINVRRTMRLIVLGNLIGKEDALVRRAWCYWTPAVYELWRQGQSQFFNPSSRHFDIAPSPLKNLPAPKNGVTLKHLELFDVHVLYSIEDSFVNGLRTLDNLVQSKARKSPRDFEKAMGDFGSALAQYDGQDESDNTVFAVFDKLIQLYAGPGPHRNSSLELNSILNGQAVTKMLVA
jgi:hypothetical protein